MTPSCKKLKCQQKLLFFSIGNRQLSFNITVNFIRFVIVKGKRVWSSSNIYHAVCERQEMKLSNIHYVSSSGLLVRDEGGTQVRARVFLMHHG